MRLKNKNWPQIVEGSELQQKSRDCNVDIENCSDP